MPITKHFRDRGANITVTAAGEVLFMPGGQVHGWTRRFGNQVKRWTAEAAPSNKRPRWAHYGKPLKQTIIAQSPRFRATAKGARVYATVGSSAPHAYYVDQGTGIYAGRGPYDAKILPPWTRQSPSLYEHTWKVPRSAGINDHGERVVEWEELGTVMVRGQRGQRFFKAGLDRAFMFMIRSGQRSAAGKAGLTPKIGKALNELPHGMDNFKGNTPSDPNTKAGAAFIAQLEEWRSWRSRAWYSKDVLGLGLNKERVRRELQTVRKDIRDVYDRDARREASRIRSQRYRDKVKALAAARARIAEQEKREARDRAKADKALRNAAIKRRQLAAYRAERDKFLADVKAKYGNRFRIELSGRRKHAGGYAYHLQLFGPGGRLVYDDWFPSAHQANI